MKRIVSIICLLVLVSCAGLRPDPVIPAIAVGYPTLEFKACEQTFHGLGICSVEKGNLYDDVSFQVQGYYKGTGRVFSQNCNLDQTFSYIDSEIIKIDLEGEAVKDCLISVTLSPEYPKQNSGEIAVYSLQGHLEIKVKNQDEMWNGQTRKLTGNWKNKLNIKLGVGDLVRVVIRGCGVRYDKEHKVKNGIVTIELSEAMLRKEKELCILEGVIFDPQYEDYLFTVMVAQYATELPNDPKWKDYRFIKLAIPSVKIGKKLEVVATSEVSVVGLDDKNYIKNEKKFKFKKDRDHILRIVTVKGRSVIGVWKASEAKWTWEQ